MIDRVIRITYKLARQIVVAVIGTTILIAGVVMLITPGPAIIVIPLGLAILSIEFAWARTWLHKLRRTISNQTAKARASRRV